MEVNTKSNTTNSGVSNTTPESCLIPGKKIKIKPTTHRRTIFITGTDPDRVRSEQIMLTGTSRSVICPLDSNMRLVNPFTQKEKLYLEYLTGKSLDTNKVDCYLSDPDLRLTVTKMNEDIDNTFSELDLGNAYDYILYKICLISPTVCNYRSDNYKAEELLFIDDEGETVKEEVKYSDLEDYVLDYTRTIKTDKKRLIEFLTAYVTLFESAKVVDPKADIEWLYLQIKEMTKDKKQLINLDKLVRLIKEDPAEYAALIFVHQAQMIAEITYNAMDREYRLSTGVVIGKTMKEVRNYFKNPVNQITKLKIEDQIKLQYK